MFLCRQGTVLKRRCLIYCPTVFITTLYNVQTRVLWHIKDFTCDIAPNNYARSKSKKKVFLVCFGSSTCWKYNKVTYLFAVLFKQPQLEALIQLHLLVLPQFMRMRMCRAHGGELSAHSARRAAVEGGLASATASFGTDGFRCF